MRDETVFPRTRFAVILIKYNHTSFHCPHFLQHFNFILLIAFFRSCPWKIEFKRIFSRCLLSLLYRPRLELVFIVFFLPLPGFRRSAFVVIAGLIAFESLESFRELVDVDVSTVSKIQSPL